MSALLGHNVERAADGSWVPECLAKAYDSAGWLGMPVDTTFALEMAPQQVELLRRGLARVLTCGRADTIPPQLRV